MLINERPEFEVLHIIFYEKSHLQVNFQMPAIWLHKPESELFFLIG